MKRKILLALLCIVTTTSIFSQQLVNQLSGGGTPWGYKFSQFDNEIPIINMGGIDLNTLQAEDVINDQQKNGTWRFGYDHYTSYNLNNSGVWKTLDNGDKVWRVGINCPGAITINLAFKYLSIPQGAKLFIYNEDKSIKLGAFTQQYVSPELELGTELLDGESVIIEYYVPAACANIGSLEIFRITHGYRSTASYADRNFGTSGACENNARCFPAYDNNIRSVVMLIMGGGTCSGSLINNTCNNGTPYVLTANHCGSTGFSSWVFRFNWEAPGCTQPGTSPSYSSISGGTQRAAYAGADLSMVQINSAVPAGYNAYFAGWDRNNTVTTSQYGIHHPDGDIKKISFATGTAATVTYNSATCWQTGMWTDGVTEGGSSGSPLFNSSGLIIGQLYGGPSNCGCENVAGCGYDYYGKLFTSWTGGGADASRLSNWLAPSGCGAAPTTLVGYDPNAASLAYEAEVQSIVAPTGTICSGNVTPSIVIKNNGTTTLTSMTINYQVDGGSATAYAWTGSLATYATATVTMPVITATAGAHTYTATIVTTSLNGSQTDLSTANNTLTSNFTAVSSTSLSLPFVEGFESVTFPPTNWTNENPNGNTGSALWVRTTTCSGFGGSTACALNDQITPTASTIGQIDNLITPGLNLTSQGTPMNLTFSVANARYDNTYYDSLVVWISVNCGASWARLASYGNNSGGNLLATAPDNGGAFTPTAAQWATKTISLDAYASQTSAQIRFQLISGWGNNTFIDNVNITGSSLTPPVSSFTVNDSTICVGQTATYTNTSTSATTFSWSFPGGSPTTGTTSPITVTYATAGTYSTTLTATNINGSNISTHTITVSANPSTTASNTGAYCAGSTIQLNASGGTTYAWSGPGGYSNTTQNPTRPTSTTAMSGVYTVIATNTSGCTASATTTVTVNAIPTATSSNTGSYCTGNTISLTSSGGTAYSWNGPLAYINGTQNPTIINSTTGMTGVYTVTVTNASGCTSTSSTTVTINTTPTATASNTGSYCEGNTIQLTSSGGTTYSWSGPSAYSNGTQNPTIASSTIANSGTYTVTATSNGCSSTSLTIVTVNANPISTTSNTGPYCPGNTIQLNSSGGSGYTWVGPAAFSNGTQNPTIASAATANNGVYTVTVTSAFGCTSTSTTTVVVVNTSSSTATNTGPYCVGQTINLTTITGGTGYAWIGPNSFSNSTQNPTIGTSTLVMAGDYSVTITFAGGCTSSATTTVTINDNPASPAITPTGATTFCAGNTVTLTSSNATGNTWSTAENTAAIIVNTTGTYIVTYTNINGCTSTASQLVTVNALPTVFANATATTLCIGATLTLTGSGATTYTWDNSVTNAITFAPIATTIYNVTGTDANGCTNTDNITVTVNALPNTAVTQAGTVLTASLATGTFQWINCTGNTAINGETNQVYTALANGDYAVIITENGCADTSICFNVNNVGLNENNSITTINIYPNPTEQFIQIKGLETGIYAFTIYNNLGQVIKGGELLNNTVIDMGIVATGTYYLKIDNRYFKIIKK